MLSREVSHVVNFSGVIFHLWLSGQGATIKEKKPGYRFIIVGSSIF